VLALDLVFGFSLFIARGARGVGAGVGADSRQRQPQAAGRFFRLPALASGFRVPVSGFRVPGAVVVPVLCVLRAARCASEYNM
jgi:hypothetical protein